MLKRRIVKWLIRVIPFGVLRRTVLKWERLKRDGVYCIEGAYFEQDLLEKHANYLADHFDQEVSRIRKLNRFMVIKKGSYSYEYFNVCLLNEMVALAVFSLFNDCIPIISLHESEDDCFHWNWYFKDIETVLGCHVRKGARIIECDRTFLHYSPPVTAAFSYTTKENQRWAYFYKRFVVLNENTEKYIEEDARLSSCIPFSNIGGLLLRGTDYVKVKPTGHPKQPDPDVLIEKAAAVFSENGIKRVYVATEEKRLFDKSAEYFGKEYTLQNKRSYYDERYLQGSLEWIGEVHFDRENDNYLKGLEYLSSLVILSRCRVLVASACGGTTFALFYSKGYDYVYIYNDGCYD